MNRNDGPTVNCFTDLAAYRQLRELVKVHGCPNRGVRPWVWPCPECWSNVFKGRNYRGHIGELSRSEWIERYAMPVWAKKSQAPSADAVPALSLAESDRKRYEALVEMMELSSWEDGTPRQTSTMTLFIDSGSLKACLNDRDGDRTAWVSADSFKGLLDALEKGLRDDSLDWRHRQPDGKQRRPSGQKRR